MRKYPCLVLLSLSVFSSADVWGQIELDEAKLVTQIIKLNEAKSEAETDFSDSVFVHILRQKLILPETFSFPFPRLSDYMKITTSTDGQIRFYSWQLPIDGSRRRIHVVAQFKTKEGKIIVQQLHYFGKEEDTAAENGIYTVYPVKYDQETSYLTFGWGTYGQGMQHQVICLYRIEKDSLIKTVDGLPRHKEITIQYPRNADCKLQYDVNSQEISYISYSLNEDMGYYYPHGNTIRLKLMKTGFVKQ